MFPLGSVLFPHAVLPLHVFEPRYRVMMRECLAGDGEFGVVLIERGSEVGGGDSRFDVGTLARILEAAELPDGRYAIATVGVSRFHVMRWLPDDPFPQAEIEAIADPEPTPAAEVARDRAFAAFTDVLQLWHRLDERVPTTLPPPSHDPVRDLFEVAATAPFGPLDAQRVLEASGDERGALVEQLLSELADDLRARLAFE
jgi:Lon protease-like protein